MGREKIAGLIVVGAACAVLLPAAGFPPEAMRNSAPESIDGALKVGAKALAIELSDHRGRRWSLAKRPKGTPAVIVFYRGHW